MSDLTPWPLPTSPSGGSVNFRDFSKTWRMFPAYDPTVAYAGDSLYAIRLGKMLKAYAFRRNQYLATDRIGLMWYGFDVVSALDDLKAYRGSLVYSVVYNGAVWFFHTKQNQEKFLANPSKYMPNYGGFCALCLSKNRLVPPDQNGIAVRHTDSRLYFDGMAPGAVFNLAEMNVVVSIADPIWLQNQFSSLPIAPQTPLSVLIWNTYAAYPAPSSAM